ncbi:MAG: FAD-dependent oxidoreductase [Deltaproteobacteria bacterium]|nr:FAD-dependent oxidoreductase [Deltaproteobacteria bacterium]
MTPGAPIVVVGASLAGLRVVEALRRRGETGSITWIGEEPVAPYDRPPLSKQLLRGEVEPERVRLASDEALAALDVELRLGCRAVGLDVTGRTVRLASGETLPYRALVAATGARARRLPGTDGLAGVFALRTLDDAMRLRASLARGPRVAIVGAGFIGLEVAASCRALGLEVTVVEAARTPLAPLGEVVGEGIAELHRERGVALHLGASVARVLGAGAVEALELTDGSRVPADVVVAGIGVTPSTDWLEGSGAALDDGVLCDARGATSAPDVFACGDVARWENPLLGERRRVEHWSSAAEQAGVVAARILEGEATAPLLALPYFWSDQYDAKLQFVGRARPGDEFVVVEGAIPARGFVAEYRRAGRLVAALVVNRPAALVRYRRALRDPAPPA